MNLELSHKRCGLANLYVEHSTATRMDARTTNISVSEMLEIEDTSLVYFVQRKKFFCDDDNNNNK